MDKEQFALVWGHFQKEQKKNFKFLLRDLKTNKWVQMSLMGAAASVLFSVFFMFLTNLVGALISSMVILFLLDKVFGFKINPQFFAQQFAQGF